MLESTTTSCSSPLLYQGLTRLPRPHARLAGFLFLAILIELGLVAAHFGARALAVRLGEGGSDGSIGVFDLADEATLAVWFSSFQLLLCAIVAFGLSQLEGRPGRRDRLWLWGATAFFVMSIDETAGMHEVFGKLLERALPSVPLDARSWWPLGYLVAFGGYFGLAVLRLRSTWLPCALTLLGYGCWVLSQAADHQALFGASAALATEEGLEMFGTTWIVVALSLRALAAAGLTRGSGAS